MNRFDQFTSSILRFLQRRERETQHSLHSASVPGSGEPQPGVRMLDTCQDIAQEYSRSLPADDLHKVTGVRITQVREREIYRKETPQGIAGSQHPAPVKTLDSVKLQFWCTCPVSLDKLCDEPAVGICKHCLEFVCANDLAQGYCYYHRGHEITGYAA